MKMSVRLDMAEIKDMMDDAQGIAAPAAQDTCNQLALLTQGEAVRAIQRGPATGIVYQKYNPRRTHRASAPGQAPMTDEGMLARSIAVDTKTPKSVRRLSDVYADTGSNLVYALFLEEGTRDMAKRPFMYPAFLGAMKVAPKLMRSTFVRRWKLGKHS